MSNAAGADGSAAEGGGYFDQYPKQTLAAAARHQTEGRLPQAEALYRQVLEHDPNNAQALHLLGVAALQARDAKRALKLLGAAAGAKPDDPEVLNSLGLAYRHNDQLDEAGACFDRVLAQQPDNADAHNNRADLLAAQGDLDGAVVATERALSLKPDFPQALFNLANLLSRRGELTRALGCYDRAAELAPDDWQIVCNKGLLLARVGELDGARTCLRQALLLDPGNPLLTLNLASVLLDAGDFAAAEAQARQAAALLPTHAAPHNTLGLALLGQGKQAEATLALLKALSLDKKDPKVQLNLGTALRLEGKLEQAISCYDRALALDPALARATVERATARLTLGRYERQTWLGLAAERLATRRRPVPGEPPRWDGSDPTGKTILLLGEGGLGNMLFHCRFIQSLKALGALTALECPPPVQRLCQRSALAHRLFEPQDPPKVRDAMLQLDELPFWLEATPQTAPAPPYLTVDPLLTKTWAEALAAEPDDRRPRVGFLWRAEGTGGDPHRDIPLAALGELMAQSGCRWLSLQYDTTDEDRAQLAALGAEDLAPRLADVADALACVAQLDLLITPQNPVAHLAGAADLPGWVLLPNAPDWTWGLTDETTPWYPSLRLFRRPKYGPWTDLLQTVGQALATQVQQETGSNP